MDSKDKRNLAVAAVVGVGLVLWRVKPAKAAEIIAVNYEHIVDGEPVWEGLNNATLPIGTAKIGVPVINKFSASLNLMVTLNDMEVTAPVDPNEEATFIFYVPLLDEGDVAFTAVLTEMDTMIELHRVTVTATVKAPQPAKFVASNLVTTYDTPLYIGDSITFEWKVTNTGGVSGTHTPKLQGAIPYTLDSINLVPDESIVVSVTLTVPIGASIGVNYVFADGIPGSFFVTEGVLPTPKGHVDAIMYEFPVGSGNWNAIDDVEFQVGDRIAIGCTWVNDLTGYNVRGYCTLCIYHHETDTSTTLTTGILTLTPGEDAYAAAGYYTFTEEGSYDFEAVLFGETIE